MSRDELRQCFAMIVAAWPHFKPLPETFKLGERLLAPMDARAVAAAIEQFSLEGREFAPPLGLVARRAHELCSEVNGTKVPDAHHAMTEVYDRISRVGIYGTPTWSHPAIGATIEALGGWEAACLDDNPEAFRAHFIRLYETMKGRVEREALEAPSLRELRAYMGATVPALRAASPAAEEIPGPEFDSEPLASREALLDAIRQRQISERSALEPDAPRRISLDAHSFGDHSLCGPMCPDRPQEAPAEPTEGETSKVGE